MPTSPSPSLTLPCWQDSVEETLQETAQSQGGWLGFDQFMAVALGHPREGYYNRVSLAEQGSSPLGAKGDFMTAPLLGPWLAGCLARRFCRLREESLSAGRAGEQGEAALSIRELGPGTGQLAADLLLALDEANALPTTYELVETNPGLAALQQSRLQSSLPPAVFSRLRWVPDTGLDEDARADEGGEAFAGLVIANEVADALPVKVFEWLGTDGHLAGGAAVLEWGLVPSDGGWAWASRPAGGALLDAVTSRAAAVEADLGGWQSGHRGEWSPWLAPWARALAQGLDWGEIVVLDYGYEAHELDHPDRSGGTLAAHRAHHRLDDWAELVASPGGQDLTAHVNFTALAEAFMAAGCTDLRLKTQAAWLLDQGLLELAEARLFPDPQTRGRPPADLDGLRALSQLQTLLSDADMGQRFLVLSARRS